MMALKDHADFELLTNYTRRWDERLRPFPPNASWVTHFEKGRYDFAILNIDQQCGNSNLNKSVLTKQMKEVVKEDQSCKIIFINHGTPVYPEYYKDGTRLNKYVSPTLRDEIMDIVGDELMVVNSYEAQENWGRGEVIIHGMGLDEWYVSNVKEPRVATFVSQQGIGDKYYNRSFLVSVMEELEKRHGIQLQWINTPKCFNAKDIDDYKNFLSKTLIYFNPTYASPMPRSRTEAMLSGCCIVTTKQHGADSFIKDGYNGIIVPHDNPDATANVIARLIKDYSLAKEMGKNARKTAEEMFNRERYKQDWLKLLNI
jgi:glycosyltransferase involved in cell wall biosynthesis